MLATAPFLCLVASVTDGDTLRCQDGTRVRLAGVDAAELPGHCRRGRHCAPGDPYAARRALQRLAGGQTLRCVAVGVTYGRVAAFCTARGVDLSCEMVRHRQAVVWRRYWRSHVCR